MGGAGELGGAPGRSRSRLTPSAVFSNVYQVLVDKLYAIYSADQGQTLMVTGIKTVVSRVANISCSATVRKRKHE